jgi:glycosyltransferase involved in cell wall biosynthesis
MKVAIYTKTRDRLEYTKRSFKSLKENAGYPYDHYVIDNGSTDGTQEWLKKQKDIVVVGLNKENEGISKANNRLLETILKKDYDLVISFDNDCFVVSSDSIKQIVDVYKAIPPFYLKFMLSPRVEGLNYPPQRIDRTEIEGHEIGITPIIGGIFQISTAECMKQYRFPEDLAKAKGQDEDINYWFHTMGGITGYIEDIVVEHMDTTDGQKKKYPNYFARKSKEEIK